MPDPVATTLMPVQQEAVPNYSFEFKTYSPSPRQDSLEECFGKANPSMVASDITSPGIIGELG
jgi:hypothetical protein